MIFSWNIAQRLSIFGRTFIFVMSALLVAEGIGIALQLSRAPARQSPVRLFEIVLRLREAGDRGPPRWAESAGPGESLGDRGVPPREFAGPPMGGAPPAMGAPPQMPEALAEAPIDSYLAAAAPSPPKWVDTALSQMLRAQLAQILGIPPDSVQFFVGANDVIELNAEHAPPGEVAIRREFIAARRLQNGQWRVLVNTTEAFPTAFERQAVLLFGIGAVVLLPLSWVFAQALSSPIRRFSEAAKRLGSDPAAPPLARAGPAEMRDAVDSFNAMQGRLNRLLQERTQMVGAIAHDLRTPLTRMAFRLGELEPTLREKVYADIDEMKMMIAAVLEFIRDRSRSARRERLDFRVLVESVVDDQSDLGHDVTFEAGEPLTLEGDPLALKRAVVNLIENAVKYGERARVRLLVTKGRCLLEIDDDGPGIAPAVQQRVFEPFFRTESSRNRDTGGIGLGLATVHSIVIDHGGEVSLANRKGGGLRATVALPIEAV